ncbi:hypothetical protein ACIGXM_22435 [Kitasatospora sp. NPDC052896]|uniref:hypothetical protein n=1 Tax=Kitasatospora sp. NPDC052896 TaxID=3364061 RepID=UPI0037CAC5BE
MVVNPVQDAHVNVEVNVGNQQKEDSDQAAVDDSKPSRGSHEGHETGEARPSSGGWGHGGKGSWGHGGGDGDHTGRGGWGHGDHAGKGGWGHGDSDGDHASKGGWGHGDSDGDHAGKGGWGHGDSDGDHAGKGGWGHGDDDGDHAGKGGWEHGDSDGDHAGKGGWEHGGGGEWKHPHGGVHTGGGGGARMLSSSGIGQGLGSAFALPGGKSEHVKAPGDVEQRPADTHTVANGLTSSGIGLVNGMALFAGGVALGASALRRRSAARNTN